jgi:hypothetical protein
MPSRRTLRASAFKESSLATRPIVISAASRTNGCLWSLSSIKGFHSFARTTSGFRAATPFICGPSLETTAFT